MISKETHIKIVLEMAGSGVPGKVQKMMNVEKIYWLFWNPYPNSWTFTVQTDYSVVMVRADVLTITNFSLWTLFSQDWGLMWLLRPIGPLLSLY